MVVEDIKSIIEKIKREYKEINWGDYSKSFSTNSSKQMLVQYTKEWLIDNYKNAKRKFFIINGFSDASLNWKPALENYFAITEITSEPTTGNLEVTKYNGREIIENSLGENYFLVEQDFFRCHFIKVDNEKQYLSRLKSIFEFKSLDDFRQNLSIEMDDWDDYGYKTVLKVGIWDEVFTLRVNPRTEEMRDYLKGYRSKPTIEDLCSLGDVSYYDFIKKYLPNDARKEWFELTNDIAYDKKELERLVARYESKEDEFARKFEFGFTPPYGKAHNFFNNSFMRTTSLKEIVDIFHPIATAGIAEEDGTTELVEEEKEIEYVFSEEVQKDKGQLTFKNYNSSQLPMNVYAIIGGNGSGKSYKINEIIRRHIEKDNNFSQIFHFSLSPFDDVIRYKDGQEEILKNIKRDEEGNLIYEKIGYASVRKPYLEQVLNKLSVDKWRTIKEGLETRYDGILYDGPNGVKQVKEDAVIDIKDSFIWYIQNMLLDLIASDKIKLWGEALSYFSFEPWVNDIREAFEDREITLQDFEKITNLSSGQATIILYITKLVSSINRGSLVIFDEPETFMHPPMMKAFIRAVSDIAQSTKAKCLVATHSPVIIQEIPHVNVFKLDLEHNISPITYKTYGQNLDSLYKNAYGIALQQTGYNDLLNKCYTDVLKKLDKLKEDLERIRKERIQKESLKEDLEHIQEDMIKDTSISILYEGDEGNLGDEAYLKYILLQDELEEEFKKIKREVV